MQLLMSNAEKAANRGGWLKARLGDDTTGACIGGSVIAAITGLDGAHGRAYKVWSQLTGRWDDDEPTRQMRFGNFCEPISREFLAEDHTDLHFTDGGLYCHDSLPWWRVTFDLLAHPAGPCMARDEMGVDCLPPAATVQQKNTLFDDWGENGIPAAYRAQALWEAGVLLGDRSPGTDGAPEVAFLAPFDRNKVAVDLFEIPLDDQALTDIGIMLEAAEWMRDLVRRDVPPPVDGHPSTGEALRKRWRAVDAGRTVIVPWQTAARWRRAGQAGTRAKERHALYGNRILAAAGDAAVVLARDPATGELVKVATRSVAPRRGYTVDPVAEVVTLRPVRSWKP